MKRLVSVFLLIITLSLLLAGCTQKSNTATTSGDSLRNYNDFTTEFKELVSKLPDYTILQLEDVALEDNATCHVFHIKDSVLGETYRLRVDTDKDSKITWVFLSTERKSYGNLQFAVFSLYAYEAMGFPEIDADSFYDEYDLFSKEKIFESTMCDGYEITSMTIDTTSEITFSIQIPKE